MISERNKQDYQDQNGKYTVRKFLEWHKDLIDPEPPALNLPFDHDIDIEWVLSYLGSQDGMSAYIKTPLEIVEFNYSNLNHLINENNKERVLELPRIVETLKNPNLIIETDEGSKKNNYIKGFSSGDIRNAQFVAVKILDDMSFYVTTFRLADSKFRQKLESGKIVYDLSDQFTSTTESKEVQEQVFELQDFVIGNIEESTLAWLMSTDAAFKEVKQALQDQGYEVKQVFPDQKVNSKYLYATINNVQVQMLRADLYSKSVPALVQQVLSKYENKEESNMIEIDPDVLKIVNEASNEVNFFNSFTELKPGQYLVRRQTYTTHYDPTRDFDYVMYETQPEFPKESHWGREGYFDVKLMEEPVVAYIKGRYDNPLQVANCTKLCTYYDSVGDDDEGGTWYKEFYYEILRIDSVEPVNYETAEHTPEEAYAILGLEYPYKSL